jgi:WD40 repeat protein
MGGDALSYVERRADHELLEALLAGEFCYLLTPRQMGKSSLIIRTRQRLVDRQVQVVLLDLSTIGQHLSVEQWYYGLLFGVGQQTGLEDELDRFFERRSDLGLCQRFFAALTEVVLPRCAPRSHPDGSTAAAVRLVVFVDELDVVRSLPFNTDEFFAAIRGCYNLRARDPALHQLGFALLGVATPADLIRDVRTSPFNIGRRIQLRDFTREEARPLARGLGPADLAQARLDRILHWTGGHPYLTQRLCQSVASSPLAHANRSGDPATEDPGEIDRICLALFLSRQAREEDDNLIFVRESVLRSESDRTALLELYRRVKRQRASVPDDHANPLVNVLHLSGLIGSENGFLCERNRVYAQAFDQAWIDAVLPGAEVRRQRAAFRRGVVRTAGISLAILAIILGLAWQIRSKELARYLQVLQNQSTTVRLTVANGVNHLNNGDWFTACLWFAQALVLDQAFNAGTDPKADQTTHRLRLQSIFNRAPQINQMWFGLARGGSAGGFTPDGTRVLLGHTNGHALFDIETGQRTTPLFGAGFALSSLSPDGTRAVIANPNASSQLLVWDVNTGTLALSLKDETGTNDWVSACHDLQFAPDGRTVAAALVEGRGGIWDAATGHLLRWLDHKAEATVDRQPNADGLDLLGVRFDATSERIVTTGTDGRAMVWRWQTTQPPQVIQAHDTWVYAAAFAPWDTNLLVTCSFDRSAHLWELSTGRRLLTVDHPGDAIRNVAFSPTERLLVTAGWDLAVRLWDSDTGRPIPPVLRDPGRTMKAMFSPDGDRLLTSSWDGVARVWDLRRDQQSYEPTPRSFASDGRLALDYEPRRLRILDAASGRELVVRKFAGNATVAWAEFAGNSDRVLAFLESSGPDGVTHHAMQVYDALRATPMTPAMPCSPGITNLTWTADSARFAAIQPASTSGPTHDTVMVWDAAGETLPVRITQPEEEIVQIALRPQGDLLATLWRAPEAKAERLRLHQAEDGRLLAELFRSSGLLKHLAFSPDGRWLAVAESNPYSLDRFSARIWEASEGGRRWKETPPLPHLDGLLFVRFSGDSQLLATCSEDQTAIIWRLTNGTWRASARPMRCDGQVIACTFSSNHTWLATICNARSPQRGPHRRVQLWDVAHSEPIGLPYEFPKFIHGLQFVAQDTQLLVEGGSPTQRWLIDLSTGDAPASTFLVQAEMFSGQHSFLSERARIRDEPQLQLPGLEEILPYSTGMGPLRPLSVEECAALWWELRGSRSRPLPMATAVTARP